MLLEDMVENTFQSITEMKVLLDYILHNLYFHICTVETQRGRLT
jgi:hypothetical protein